MARPDTTLASINAQAGNWDQIVDTNTDKVEEFLFQKPYPIPVVHIAAGDEGSTPLSGYPAASYKWCVAIVVDPASVGTNGNLIYSDGTNWKYQRTGTNV